MSFRRCSSNISANIHLVCLACHFQIMISTIYFCVIVVFQQTLYTMCHSRQRWCHKGYSCRTSYWQLWCRYKVNSTLNPALFNLSAPNHPLSFPFMFLELASYRGGAFSNIAPRLWKSLPKDLKQMHNITLFQQKLKTHSFILAFQTIWQYFYLTSSRPEHLNGVQESALCYWNE